MNLRREIEISLASRHDHEFQCHCSMVTLYLNKNYISYFGSRVG